MNRGTWQATVHGVAKSPTRLKIHNARFMTWGVFICGVPWDLARWYQSWFFLERWAQKARI